MTLLAALFDALVLDAARGGQQLSAGPKFGRSKVVRSVETSGHHPASGIVAKWHLEAFCRHEGRRAPNTDFLMSAQLAVWHRVPCRTRSGTLKDTGHDQAFSRSHAAVAQFGNPGSVPSDHMITGSGIQACQIECPPYTDRGRKKYRIVIRDVNGRSMLFRDLSSGRAVMSGMDVRDSVNVGRHPTGAIGIALDQSYRVRTRYNWWQTR